MEMHMNTGSARLLRDVLTVFALSLAAIFATGCGDDDANDPGATPTTQPASATPPGGSMGTGNRELQPGTYTSEQFAVPVTLTVGEGWEVVVDRPDIYVVEHPAAEDGPFGFIGFLLPEQAYNPTETNLVLGPAPEDFVAWFSSHRLIDVVSTEPVTLGGLTGTRLDLAIDQGERFDILETSDGPIEVRFRDRFAVAVLDANERQLLVMYGSDLPINFEAFDSVAQAVLATVTFNE